MEKKWRISGYVDCHCHLTDSRIISELPEMLERAKAEGIETFLAGGVDSEDWQRQVDLAQTINLLPCFGLHPYWVAKHSGEEFAGALKLLESKLPHAIAIGEIGLDFRPEISRGSDEWQREAFAAQTALANRLNKVAVLHLVKCHHDVSARPNFTREAIVHAFNAGPEVAKLYLDAGYCLSVGGLCAARATSRRE
jgi:TatD DNase family protein